MLDAAAWRISLASCPSLLDLDQDKLSTRVSALAELLGVGIEVQADDAGDGAQGGADEGEEADGEGGGGDKSGAPKGSRLSTTITSAPAVLLAEPVDVQAKVRVDLRLGRRSLHKPHIQGWGMLVPACAAYPVSREAYMFCELWCLLWQLGQRLC